ncbi:phosphotransferase [Jeotgalibacillus marinus]|uniref:Phosphotransferase n=1 Tax=Jeotgalibacillus marinus TaxID=86667 RepID=A0ABV3Q144_9BACL
MNNKIYKYILIDNSIYINTEQGVIDLFINLYNMKPFSFFGRTTRSEVFNRLPAFIIRGLRVLQFIYEFHKKRLNGSSNRVITSHFFGGVMLELRQGGYKIFNLKKQEVMTVFPKQMPLLEIEERIRTTREAARCSLAPKVIKWSVAERYLTEEYINLKSPLYSFDNREKLCSEVFPILENILLTTEPEVLPFETYTRDKVIHLELLINRLQSTTNETISNVEKVKGFISLLKMRLQEYSRQKEIVLTFSHGDFCEGNILIANQSSRVIDWNTLGSRSFYFDFYHMMFKVGRYENMDQQEIARYREELEAGVELFYTKLRENANFHSLHEVNELNSFAVYRYLFYIELIILKLQFTGFSDDEKITRLMKWIRRIEVFEKVDAESYGQIGKSIAN